MQWRSFFANDISAVLLLRHLEGVDSIGCWSNLFSGPKLRNEIVMPKPFPYVNSCYNDRNTMNSVARAGLRLLASIG